MAGTLRTGGRPFRIGSDGTAFSLVGRVDEVAVFATALRAANQPTDPRRSHLPPPSVRVPPGVNPARRN